MYNGLLGFGYWTLVQYVRNSPRRCHLRAIVIDYADVVDHDIVTLPIRSDLVAIIINSDRFAFFG
jgi:hypothetical protein